jgi:hypothetical protein
MFPLPCFCLRLRHGTYIRLVQVRFGSVLGAFVLNPEPDLEFGSTEIPNLNRTWGSVQAVQVRFGRTLALFGKRSGEFGLLPEREPNLDKSTYIYVLPYSPFTYFLHLTRYVYTDCAPCLQGEKVGRREEETQAGGIGT